MEDPVADLTMGLILLVSGFLAIRFPEASFRWMTWGFGNGSNWKETMRFFGGLYVLCAMWLIGKCGWYLITHEFMK